MVKWLREFISWLLKFYWAFFYVWLITLGEVVKINVPSGFLVLRNWLIIIAGAIFGIGFLSLWAGGHDFLKR